MTDSTPDVQAEPEVHDPEQAVIKAGVRLDAAEVPQMRLQLESVIKSGANLLTVDLSDTEFIDSAGLASLVRALTTLRRRGGELELIRPRSADAWRVFRLTQFDSVFTVYASTPAQVEVP
jgi:anti-sigma B factor antagonist